MTPVTDPELLTHQEIYFNAARLDRSLALDTRDYVRLANPYLHPITPAANRPPDSTPRPATDRRPG